MDLKDIMSGEEKDNFKCLYSKWANSQKNVVIEMKHKLPCQKLGGRMSLERGSMHDKVT